MSSRRVDKHVCKRYLYTLTFPNGMVYVGISYDVYARWANDGAGYEGQTVYDAIREFGWENIVRKILLFLPGGTLSDSDTIRKLEREFIRAYGDRAYNSMSRASFHAAAAGKARSEGRYEHKVFWTIDGCTRPAVEWCKLRGASYARAKRAIDNYGIAPEQAMVLPPVPAEHCRRPVEYWRSLGYDFFKQMGA